MKQELIRINQEILREILPLDVGCTCQAMGFYTVALNLFFVVALGYLLYRITTSRRDPLFPFLFSGFLALFVSEIIDWWQSVIIAHTGYLMFRPGLYSVQEGLRIVGFLIIFIAIFRTQKKLRT